MPTTAPPYTIDGIITRPELFFDSNGNMVLTSAAERFAATYGLKLLYVGLPANTPYPPVSDSLSERTDPNPAANSVAEGVALNTPVNLTVSATSSGGNTVTYSLSAAGKQAQQRRHDDDGRGRQRLELRAPHEADLHPGERPAKLLDGIQLSLQETRTT
jgi:hypothetical protein